MHADLHYRLTNEHIADLRRAADRERFARFAKRESFLARVIARLRTREQSIGHRAPARLSDPESATRTTDVAAADA